MKFSTRAGYGLRAMVNLAHNFPEKKTIREISFEEGIPVKYLEKLMSELKKNKLVKSLRGKAGGYILAQKPEAINTGEIVEVLEGSIAPMKCVENGCPTNCECSSSLVWIKLNQQIKKTLNDITLGDLV